MNKRKFFCLLSITIFIMIYLVTTVSAVDLFNFKLSQTNTTEANNLKKITGFASKDDEEEGKQFGPSFIGAYLVLGGILELITSIFLFILGGCLKAAEAEASTVIGIIPALFTRAKCEGLRLFLMTFLFVLITLLGTIQLLVAWTILLTLESKTTFQAAYVYLTMGIISLIVGFLLMSSDNSAEDDSSETDSLRANERSQAGG